MVKRIISVILIIAISATLTSCFGFLKKSDEETEIQETVYYEKGSEDYKRVEKAALELIEEYYPEKTFEVYETYMEKYNHEYANVKCVDDGTKFYISLDDKSSVLCYQQEYWLMEMYNKLSELYDGNIHMQRQPSAILDGKPMGGTHYWYAVDLKKDSESHYYNGVPYVEETVEYWEWILDFYKKMGFKTFEEFAEYLQDYPDVNVRIVLIYAVGNSNIGTYEEEVKKVKEIMKEFVLPLPCGLYEDKWGVYQTREFYINTYYLVDDVSTQFDKEGWPIEFYENNEHSTAINKNGAILYDGLCKIAQAAYSVQEYESMDVGDETNDVIHRWDNIDEMELDFKRAPFQRYGLEEVILLDGYDRE